jgi:hypothetical protein
LKIILGLIDDLIEPRDRLLQLGRKHTH